MRNREGRGAKAPVRERGKDPAEECDSTGWLLLNGERFDVVVSRDGQAVAGAEDQTAIAELLTGRELQIVVLVSRGQVNKQIADTLKISEWTVSTHLRRIFAKLGVDTRAAMVFRCSALLGPESHEPSRGRSRA